MVHRMRQRTGFTLVEALVVLVLMALLLTLAAPSLKGLRQRQQLRGQAEAFWNSLTLARAEAMARQQRVTVCAQSVVGDCDATGPWQRGWLVFVDTNRNGQREAEELVLQRQGTLPDGMSLVGNTPVRRALAYAEEGRSVSVSGGFLAGTLTFCQDGQGQGWNVVINAVGRPRLEAADCP